MIRINLLAIKQLKAETSRRRELVIGVSGLATVLLALGGLFAYQAHQVSVQDQELASLRADLQQFTARAKGVADLQSRINEFQGKHKVIEDINKKKSGPVRVMESLSAATPAALWLTQFKETGGELTITGVSMDNQTIADFLKALSSHANFRDTELVETVQGDQAGMPQRRFLIRAKLLYQLPTQTAVNTAAPDFAGGEKQLTMNELINKILDRSKRQKIAIFAGAILLLIVVGYLYVYSPHAEQLTRLNDEAGNVRAERDRKRAIAANLPKLQRDLNEWDGKLKTAVSQLPDSREIPELLSNISTKARESGLEIVLFRPRPENLKEFYAEIPVDIVVRGGFYNAVSFFDEVGKLNRLVNIDNIDFKNPKVTGDQVALEISTLATTYRFLDEAERKKVADDKAKAAAAAKK